LHDVLRALVVFLCLLSIASTVRAEAQVQSFVPPAGTQSLESARRPIFTTAVVELNGMPLFQIAAPSQLKIGEIAAEDRALFVDQTLQLLIATDRNGMPAYDASTFRVWTHHNGDSISIVATDARHAVPLTIVTVTSADARSQQSTAEAIAASWQLSLQNALVAALFKLQPDNEKKHLIEVVEIATALLAWTTLLHFLSIRQRAVSPASSVFFWLTMVSWFIAATWSFAQFSQTTALSRNISRGATTIVIIWISAGAINRLCDLAIARVAANWKSHHHISPEEEARMRLRVPTATRVIGHFKAFALVLIAGFLSLGQLGAPITSVVTIGGIAAVAVTFSAQNFLKDVIGGIAVLYEDQYAIGDLVAINGHTGIVENVTLRIVRIRDTDGSAVTISHSAATSVSNFSRNWTRIDYQLSIAPEGDPDKAVDVVRDTVQQLAQDPDAGRGLFLPIEWIGVHAFSDAWTLIRASIRTAPLQQSTLRREINRRVRRNLSEAGIPFGPPIEPEFITPL